METHSLALCLTIPADKAPLPRSLSSGSTGSGGDSDPSSPSMSRTSSLRDGSGGKAQPDVILKRITLDPTLCWSVRLSRVRFRSARLMEMVRQAKTEV